MFLVVPHFSKSAVRKLKPVKLRSTTGFFVIFLKIFRRTCFCRTSQGGCFYLFEITFGRMVA